jgi:hypothetical protein
LVSDIPAGDGNVVNLFLQSTYFGACSFGQTKYTQKRRPGENEMEYPNPTTRKFVFRKKYIPRLGD